jgi:hypothetical protein
MGVFEEYQGIQSMMLFLMSKFVGWLKGLYRIASAELELNETVTDSVN